jgi:hypothetical protein
MGLIRKGEKWAHTLFEHAYRTQLFPSMSLRDLHDDSSRREDGDHHFLRAEIQALNPIFVSLCSPAGRVNKMLDTWGKGFHYRCKKSRPCSSEFLLDQRAFSAAVRIACPTHVQVLFRVEEIFQSI